MLSSIPASTHIPPISRTRGPHDRYGRRIHYLRISLTDACNMRCVYCMPEHMTFRPRQELMTDEELFTIVGLLAELGVDRVRLTGGEPTIRPNLVEIVRFIASRPGIREVAITTNGLLLSQLAQPLARAGLNRVNVSLDTLDPAKFRRITRGGDFDAVWAGVEAAEAAGLRPVKINVVVTRGYNDDEAADLARLTLEREWEVRFIEIMPLGSEAEFAQEAVVSSAETRQRIEAELGPLHEVPGHDGHDPARPFRLAGARGAIGFISTVTQPFCAGCNRMRLTADGKLRLCLLRDREFDMLARLRQGIDVKSLRSQIAAAVYHKPWGHGLPHGDIPTFRVMSQIGG